MRHWFIAGNLMGDKTWNAGAAVSVRDGADGWTAELSIPLKALGAFNPEGVPVEVVRGRNIRGMANQEYYFLGPYTKVPNDVPAYGRLMPTGR